MTTSETLTAMGIGALAGIIASLCGVGGGVVMVPAFVILLGLAQKNAVAASLAVIIPTALVTTIQNAKNGLLAGQWKLVIFTALASTLLAWFGSGLLITLRNDTLTRVFGLVLLVFGARMLWQGRA
ncbi:MAG: sulfite exporter TauE/SafE family protein [Verrucomicrobiaceae bacterium]|nr:sulfite exporter TauE/SafE family protein [Verrucomicrobiaceae bacterium]